MVRDFSMFALVAGFVLLIYGTKVTFWFGLVVFVYGVMGVAMIRWLERQRRLTNTIHEFFIAFFGGLAAFGLVLVAVNNDVFRNKGVTQTIAGMANSQVDWFVALGWALGITGTVWTIWAKAKAEKAEEQSRLALESLTTRSVQFRALVDGGLLVDYLRDATHELVMLLGVPAVGIFHANGSHLRVDSSLSVLRTIQEAMTMVLSSDSGKVTIVYLDAKVLKSMAKKSQQNKVLSTGQAEDFDKKIDAFESDLTRLKDQYPDKLRFASYHFSNKQGEFIDPGLRFVIVSGENRGVPYKKSCTWFVKEFTEDAPQEFEAIGLKTEDRQIIEMLEGIASYYVASFPPTAEGTTKSRGHAAASPTVPDSP
ncbi:MAG: hypothetical protein L0387_00435 [Acidobacteria bacterium]|nr:hypothetical protein [Acidobacteriota bacterium]